MTNHEDFSRAEGPEGSSDRTFGVVLAIFFFLVAVWPWLRAREPHWWCLPVSGACLTFALARPALLHPVNVLWTRLAVILNKLVSPVVTGLLFYGVFTPFGILLRLGGKELLPMQFDSDSNSYWIERKPPGPPPQSMAQQF